MRHPIFSCLFIAAMLIPETVQLLSGQTKNDNLVLRSDRNCVYAIIHRSVIEDSALSTDEAYSDFLYHSRELRKAIRIPLRILVVSSVSLDGETLDSLESGKFIYVFLTTEESKTRVFQGVDTWTSLESTIVSVYGKRFLKIRHGKRSDVLPRANE